MRPELEVADDPGAAAGAALLDAIRAVVAARGTCRLALPGGTGPVGLLRHLAVQAPGALVRRIVLTWVDERHLPLGDEGDWSRWPAESNRRLAWEHWLSRLPPEDRPREVPLDAPGSLHEAQRLVEARFLSEVGALDLAVLGVGPDGHIASLFPGHPALDAPGPVLAVPDSPKPPPERLTLSLPVIEAAEQVVLVAAGASKADVLRRAAAGDRALPIGRLAPRGRWRWFLDAAASP